MGSKRAGFGGVRILVLEFNMKVLDVQSKVFSDIFKLCVLKYFDGIYFIVF